MIIRSKFFSRLSYFTASGDMLLADIHVQTDGGMNIASFILFVQMTITSMSMKCGLKIHAMVEALAHHYNCI